MVRSSMGLAVVTGKPVRIENIRAGRSKPRLGRQHLTTVCVAAEICGGDVTGDVRGSTAIEFHRVPVRAGCHQFSIGPAGSAMLVCCTLCSPAADIGWPRKLGIC